MGRTGKDRHDLIKDLIKSGLSEKSSKIIGEVFTKLEDKCVSNLASFISFSGEYFSSEDSLTPLIKRIIAIESDTVVIKNEMINEFGKIKEWMAGFFLAIMTLLVIIIGIGVSFLIK